MHQYLKSLKKIIIIIIYFLNIDKIFYKNFKERKNILWASLQFREWYYDPQIEIFIINFNFNFNLWKELNMMETNFKEGQVENYF